MREKSRVSPPGARPARGCRPISIRPTKSSGVELASSSSSSGCDSISGRNRRVDIGRVLGPRAMRTARIGRRGRARPPRSRRDDAGHSASAVLASRAETPTRSAPVTSLISAQRPVASSASSQPASRTGSRPARPRSASTMARESGGLGAGSLGPDQRDGLGGSPT